MLLTGLEVGIAGGTTVTTGAGVSCGSGLGASSGAAAVGAERGAAAVLVRENGRAPIGGSLASVVSCMITGC